ncbi:MAG: hypothetical protein AB7T06_15855 [Kofleriaceae bacterium]
MRWTTLVVIAAFALAGCSDLRDFRGVWEGPRVGTADVVKVGAEGATSASLFIDDIDAHGLSGTISIAGLVTDAPVATVPGAEADALSGITFAGAPLRVYLAFIAIGDGMGDALAVIALFDHRRIEVRVLRGGSGPLYAIYALTDESEAR